VVVQEYTAVNQAASSDVTEKKKAAVKRRKSMEAGTSKEKEIKVKKPKKAKDDNAPQKPLNGYVRYLNQNRSRAKEANPDLSFADITKVVAAEWTGLSQEDKQMYLDEADKDKERYARENEDYKKSDSYKTFMKKQQADATVFDEKKTGKGDTMSKSKQSKDKSSTKLGSKSSDHAIKPTMDIPIFTEEFLEHNKVRESELRQLRKLTVEFEEQNAILSKHIENMKGAIEKLGSETASTRHTNDTLNHHLDQLRSILVSRLGDIPIPGTTETPTIATIGNYLVKLNQKLVKDKTSNKENEEVRKRVQFAIADLDKTIV
jgi:hypothetical protein